MSFYKIENYLRYFQRDGNEGKYTKRTMTRVENPIYQLKNAIKSDDIISVQACFHGITD